MKRIEYVLLLMSVLPLSLAAQAPASAPKTGAAQSAGNTPKADVVTQAAASHDPTAPADRLAEQPAPVSTSASAFAFFNAPPTDGNAQPADSSASVSIPAVNTELQSQIQEALKQDPTLSKCNVTVVASADGLDLTGSTGSSRERLAVWRLAESYARGKKVDNHIVVNRDTGAPPVPRRENTTPAASTAPSGAAPPGTRDNRQ